ncbi:MAG: DNA-binding protein [Deltaproteobacteria bacterium]|nr:DNA-binding protein [Deltaproteobacteria bacterium]
MDRLFLDACVLFSAAYSQTSPLRRFWELPDAVLLSSGYAIAQARRNISALRPDRLGDLEHLAGKLTVIEAARMPLPEQAASLPDKDAPILLAAMNAKATHLLTVDKRHFGALCGRTISGVLVLSPGEYLHQRR